jgi:DNA-binding CsgD family transcriptional regulator
MIADHYNQIIASLYEDVLSNEGFSGALRKFQVAFGTEQTWLVTWNRPNDLIRVDGSAGIIPEFQADYEAHYQFSDPAKENFSKISVGGWWVDSQELGLARIASSAFHQEFLRSYDMASYMGTPILRTSEQDVALSFLKSSHQGLFTDADTHSIDVIIPHLRNAFRLRERAMELAQTADLSIAVLEHLAFGIAVIDLNLRVLFHNRRGASWLSSLGPTSRWGRRHPCLDESFQEMIRTACEIRGRVRLRARASTLKASGRSPCVLVVLPLPASHRFAVAWQRPAVLVLFFEKQRGSTFLNHVLRDIYGLSNAELRLTTNMVDGRKLNEVGITLGITRETARSTLKSVFRKTGTHSQSQLIRLLTALSAVDEPADLGAGY